MKRTACLILCLMLIFTGCAGTAASQGISSTVSSAPAVSALPEENELDDLADYVIDPPYDFDPDQMLPHDFGDYFATDYETTSSTYLIAEGTEWENEVTVLHGKEEGATIYVIAGVHGDETAAWLTGNVLKKANIKAGTVYILSPVNRWGAAAEPAMRYLTGEEDLNRNFPGDPAGSGVEQVAASIFADVKRINPDFIFDLHEARIVQAGRDFLGSSLIFTSLDGIGDMFTEIVLETEMGTLCSNPFSYFSPGPAGSVNNVLTTELSIPVITVETFRGYEMERRIGDQLAIVQYVLRHYEVID